MARPRATSPLPQPNDAAGRQRDWREPDAIRTIQTARVHHPSRRRGGVAARGARAAPTSVAERNQEARAWIAAFRRNSHRSASTCSRSICHRPTRRHAPWRRRGTGARQHHRRRRPCRDVGPDRFRRREMRIALATIANPIWDRKTPTVGGRQPPLRGIMRLPRAQMKTPGGCPPGISRLSHDQPIMDRSYAASGRTPTTRRCRRPA